MDAQMTAQANKGEPVLLISQMLFLNVQLYLLCVWFHLHLQMSCTCRHVMTVPQIVSGRMQRCIWAATDWLMAEAQPDPAHLDRMLVPVAPSIKLSIVRPGEIWRPTVPDIISICHKASINQYISRSISKFHQCETPMEANFRIYFQYELNLYWRHQFAK